MTKKLENEIPNKIIKNQSCFKKREFISKYMLAYE
jgi:hypothetical protein